MGPAGASICRAWIPGVLFSASLVGVLAPYEYVGAECILPYLTYLRALCLDVRTVLDWRVGTQRSEMEEGGGFEI